jgi:TRAP-type C4-dicarboxylate transport system permease large subunit
MAAMNNSAPVGRAALLWALNGSGMTLLMPRALRVKVQTMGEARPLEFERVREAVEVNLRMLTEAFLSTVRTTTMIMLILFAAFTLQTSFGFLGISHDMSDWVAGLDLSPTQFVLVLVVFYLILGTVMESYSMLFLTLPILLPPLFRAGVDPFSFGIILIILVELTQITPPQGLCLYVLQSARRDGPSRDLSGGISTAGGKTESVGTILDVYIGVLPFIACMFVVLGLLIAFPEIVSWLPDLVRGK